MGQEDLTQWAQPTYVDDDFTIASPVGIPIFSSLTPDNTEDQFTQDFEQFRSEWEPLALNTPHDSEGEIPDYSDFFLAAEGPRQDIKGGVVRWQRTYVRPPAAYDDFESYSYPFIGFQGIYVLGNSSLGVTATGRPRQNRVVPSRVRHEFFLVGPGGGYPSAGQIPTIYAQQYLTGGLIALPTEFIQDASGPFLATKPSRTTYDAWVTAATTDGWHSPVGAGQIVVEDSRISRVRGNLFTRQTRYVLAQ